VVLTLFTFYYVPVMVWFVKILTGLPSSPPNAWQKEEKLGDRSVKIKDYIFI